MACAALRAAFDSLLCNQSAFIASYDALNMQSKRRSIHISSHFFIVLHRGIELAQWTAAGVAVCMGSSFLMRPLCLRVGAAFNSGHVDPSESQGCYGVPCSLNECERIYTPYGCRRAEGYRTFPQLKAGAPRLIRCALGASSATYQLLPLL